MIIRNKGIHVIFSVLVLMFSNFAVAKSVFISFGGEDIKVVAPLPDDERFTTAEGDYVDVGYLYKSVSIMFLPLWNYDGRLVGASSIPGRYYNLTPDQLNEIARQAGVALPAPPYLDAWQRVGGKIVFAVVLGMTLFSLKRTLKRSRSYRSALDSSPARLKDILINGQRFTEQDKALLDIDGKPSIAGMDFIATKSIFNSFITVAMFDMTHVSVQTAEQQTPDFFARAIGLKKAVKARGQAITIYMYFIFHQSPNAEERAQIKALKQRKILKAANAFPVIIDVEKQQVDIVSGAIPAKKVIETCFVASEENTEAMGLKSS